MLKITRPLRNCLPLPQCYSNTTNEYTIKNVCNVFGRKYSLLPGALPRWFSLRPWLAYSPRVVPASSLMIPLQGERLCSFTPVIRHPFSLIERILPGPCYRRSSNANSASSCGTSGAAASGSPTVTVTTTITMVGRRPCGPPRSRNGREGTRRALTGRPPRTGRRPGGTTTWRCTFTSRARLRWWNATVIRTWRNCACEWPSTSVVVYEVFVYTKHSARVCGHFDPCQSHIGFVSRTFSNWTTRFHHRTKSIIVTIIFTSFNYIFCVSHRSLVLVFKKFFFFVPSHAHVNYSKYAF